MSNKDKETAAISVIFQKQEKEEIAAWAKEHDLTFAQMVRWALREYIENHSTDQG